MDIAPLGFAVDATPLDKAATTAQDAAKKIIAVADAADAVGKATRESGKAQADNTKKVEEGTKAVDKAKRATDELTAATKKRSETTTATGKIVETVNRITQDAVKAAEDYAKAARGEEVAITATGKAITSLSGSMRATQGAMSGLAASTIKTTTTFNALGTAADQATEEVNDAADAIDGVGGSGEKATGLLTRLWNTLVVGKGLLNVVGGEAQRAGLNIGGAGGIGNAAAGATRVMQGFETVIGTTAGRLGLIGAAAAVATIAFIKMLGPLAEAQDRYAAYESRLTSALKSQQAAALSMQELTKISNDVGVGLNGTIDSFARLAQNSEALGASRGEMLQFVETVQKLGAAGNISSFDIEGAMTQLGQSLASGKLNGDELRSILERMPPLAKAIAEGMGKTTGELRAMGAAGELTADKVFAAILSQTEKARKGFETMPDTVEKANTRLSNSYDSLKAHIGELFMASEIERALVNAAASATAWIDGWVADKPANLTSAQQAKEKQQADEIKRVKEIQRLAADAEDKYSGQRKKEEERKKDIDNYTKALVDAKKRYQELEDQAVKSAAKEGAMLIALASARRLAMEGIATGNVIMEARGRSEYGKLVTAIAGGDRKRDGKGGINEQARNARGEADAALAEMRKLEFGLKDAREEQAASDKKRNKKGGGGSKADSPLTALNKDNAALAAALAGNLGGGVDIATQAAGMKGAGQATAMAAIVQQRSLEAQKAIADMKQAATSATQLSAAMADFAGDQIDMEAGAEALTWKYKTFGNTMADNAQIVIDYTKALADQKRAEQQLADTRTMKSLDDEAIVRRGQIEALEGGGGAYETRRAEAAERANLLRKQGRDPLANAQMKDFDSKESLTTANAVAKSAQVIAQFRAQAAASSSAELRNLQLQVKVDEARANAGPKDKDNAEKRVRDEDAASRTAGVKATTIGMREQVDAMSDQYALSRLAGIELKVQTALMERKRAMMAMGVDLASAEAQEQFKITEQLVLAQAALDGHLERVDALKSAWVDMVEDTKGAIGDGFIAAFRDGEDAGKAMFVGLERAGFEWVNKMVQKLAISPLLNILEQFGESAIGSVFGAKGGGATSAGATSKAANWGPASANGNVFSGGSHIPFANGGIVDRPTSFDMSGGRKGLMGEAGTEGIFPLARGGDGKLGLKVMGGGGGANVSVQVIDMRTSKGTETPQVQERRGSNGERQFAVMIRDSVKSGIRNGNYDTDLQAQYGLGRTVSEK